jgi:hypothetical protein
MDSMAVTAVQVVIKKRPLFREHDTMTRPAHRIPFGLEAPYSLNWFRRPCPDCLANEGEQHRDGCGIGIMRRWHLPGRCPFCGAADGETHLLGCALASWPGLGLITGGNAYSLHDWLPMVRCPECDVPFGALHVVGCDIEVCPKCGWQAIACWCSEGEGFLR